MTNFLLYIDPATTAILWQITIGLFISVSMILGIWWRNFTTFLRGVFVKLFNRKGAGEICKAHVMFAWNFDNDLIKIESEIESLNDKEVYEIALVMQEKEPKFEYLVDKFGIELRHEHI